MRWYLIRSRWKPLTFRVFLLASISLIATLWLKESGVSKTSDSSLLKTGKSRDLIESSPKDSHNGDTCFKEKRVALIKVHKAASTTLTSIIQRFGLFHNLTFALPRRDYYHIGFFETFHPDNVLPIPRGAVYEAVCQHVVYNRAAFRRYFPPDITIIASVRDPFQRFIATFLYFQAYSESVRSKANTVEDTIGIIRTYLKDPDAYEPDIYANGSLAMNRMSFDLGLPKIQYLNRTYVEEYLNLLDEDFTLVLVAEKFDESLVLLKRMMCWNLKDILYEVRHRSTPIISKMIPGDFKMRYSELVPSEYQIYEHFRNKLDNQLALQGDDLLEEVQFFRKTLRKVSRYCSQIDTLVPLYIESSRFDRGFTFDGQDCLYLMMNETTFVKHLIKIQMEV